MDSNTKELIAAGPRPLILRVLAKCSIFFDDWSPQDGLRQYKRGNDSSSLDPQLGQVLGAVIVCTKRSPLKLKEYYIKI